MNVSLGDVLLWGADGEVDGIWDYSGLERYYYYGGVLCVVDTEIGKDRMLVEIGGWV